MGTFLMLEVLFPLNCERLVQHVRLTGKIRRTWDIDMILRLQEIEKQSLMDITLTISYHDHQMIIITLILHTKGVYWMQNTITAYKWRR